MLYSIDTVGNLFYKLCISKYFPTSTVHIIMLIDNIVVFNGVLYQKSSI